jgi:asparaginyl-tRNA synthetase
VQPVEEKFESISMDVSLERAESVTIEKVQSMVGKRVLVRGWVQHLRKQSKKLWFLKLRDGTGYVQCVLENKLVSIFA